MRIALCGWGWLLLCLEQHLVLATTAAKLNTNGAIGLQRRDTTPGIGVEFELRNVVMQNAAAEGKKGDGDGMTS